MNASSPSRFVLAAASASLTSVGTSWGTHVSETCAAASAAPSGDDAAPAAADPRPPAAPIAASFACTVFCTADAFHSPQPSSGEVTDTSASTTAARPTAAAACTALSPSESATFGSALASRRHPTSSREWSEVFGCDAAMWSAVMPPTGRAPVGAPCRSAALNAPGDPDAAARDAAPTPDLSVAAALAPRDARNSTDASEPRLHAIKNGVAPSSAALSSAAVSSTPPSCASRRCLTHLTQSLDASSSTGPPAMALPAALCAAAAPLLDLADASAPRASRHLTASGLP
mmetsp:Transcript_14672/g.59939  ORF Transcript_14672/g.59939 Transcript_14672/m.59939 type:complete len:287 (-) Transcript_14672:356-1216(-)